MKTLLFYASVTITLFIFLSSCTKEKPDSPLVASPQSDEKLVSQVHWFMDAAKDVKEGKYLKSGEKMFLDTALYYISNTLNYKYGFHTSPYRSIKFDTVLVNMPILAAENKTYIVDALSCFNQAETNSRNNYSQFSQSNKKVIGFVVQNAGITPNGLAVTARVIMEIGYGAPIVVNSFGPNDQYWWTREGGNCSDPNNIVPGIGAPEMLDSKIYSYGWWPSVQPGYRIWYSDPAIQEFLDPTQYPSTGPIDNFCDYKIYRVTQFLNNTIINIPDKDFCLGLDALHPGIHEMDFYYNGMIQVIMNFFNTNNRSFMNIITYDRQDYSYTPPPQPAGYSIYRHEPWLTHGILHVSPPGLYPIYID